MGDFYGYNAGQFKKDYSFLESAFGTAGKLMAAIPEVAEFEKARQEGRAGNDEIYSALKEQVSAYSDEEFKSSTGQDKKTFLSLMKPRMNEGDEYFVRSAKAETKLLPLEAKKSVTMASQAIGAINQPYEQHQADVSMVKQENPELAGVMEATGGFPKGPSPASPEQVQKVARGYNVPIESLAPEYKQATDRLTTQQLGQIDKTGTQLSNTMAIGGGATPETQKAIGTLPNESQEAANMINVSEAQSKNITAKASMKRAEVDLIEAQNKAKSLNDKDKKDESERYLSLKRTISDRINDKEGRLNQINDDLNRFDIEEAEKDKLYKQQKQLTRELSRLKTDEYDANKNINRILGTKLNEGTDASDVVLDVVDNFRSAWTGKGPVEETARMLYDTSKENFKMEVDYQKILGLLKQGAKPEDIIKTIGKQAGY